MQDLLEKVQKIEKAIEAFNSAQKRGVDGSKKLEDAFDGIFSSAESASRSLETAGGAMEQFSKLAINGSNSFDGLVGVLGKSGTAVSQLALSFKQFPIIGGLLAPAISAIENTSKALVIAAEFAQGFAAAYDGIDKGTREAKDTQYKFAASLGMTFDQAEKNTSIFQDLIKANSDFAKSNVYFNGNDFRSGIAALQAAGISIQDLAKSSGVATNGMNNMQAMTMQSKAMGMDIGEYSRKMADMVRKSGLSIEDSMKMMAGVQDLSSETGLKLDEVTQSLENATSGFQKMGTTMDFGRPVLKGFAESVKDVGLGITQATDVSAEFSKSLLGIVNNPALAYVMAMKGGVGGEMGGPGGILNPSIQMEARMLDKSPGNQADMAMQQTMATKEMIASMTGGNIITLKQAAESPNLQTQFETQRQMVGSFLGINDKQSQSRVLELLSNLDQATAAGDDELVQKINDQIEDAKNANGKTLDVQQKISQSIDRSLVLMQEEINLRKASPEGKSIEADVMRTINEITKLSESLIGVTDEDKIKGLKDQIKEQESKLPGFAAGVAAKVQAADSPGAIPSGTPMGTTNVANGNTATGVASATVVNLTVSNIPTATVEATSGSTSAGIPPINIVRKYGYGGP